ncbi:MAG: hypothetical protein K6T90_08005, partial [Leptolyngbyaceae cyanobacterium HOT.MB2.61]|nr:hypothetical protein [Leptolyngbyaceae cyanobacterium HOT.MB2.61]
RIKLNPFVCVSSLGIPIEKDGKKLLNLILLRDYVSCGTHRSPPQTTPHPQPPERFRPYRSRLNHCPHR